MSVYECVCVSVYECVCVSVCECVRVCVCARGSRLSVTVRCTDQPGEARARFVLNKRVVLAGVQPDPTGSPGARGWLTAARGCQGEV